jgi:hypothetical protein
MAFLTAREWTHPDSTVLSGYRLASCRSRRAGRDRDHPDIRRIDLGPLRNRPSIASANSQGEDAPLFDNPVIAAALRAHRPVLLATLLKPSS